MQNGIGVPNELVSVSGYKTQVLLLNVNEGFTEPEQYAIATEPDFREETERDARTKVAVESSVIRVNPVNVYYEREFFEPHPPGLEPEQDQIFVSLLDNSVNVIHMNQRPEPTSDFDSANESELPIVMPEQAPTAYPTRPNTDNARKICLNSHASKIF